MTIIDLRSDTLTFPSEAMRQAMVRAELGDDVFGEDPSVNALQDYAADLLGKEAALFVSSGTMGNLVGILLHASRGQEVIVDADSHVFRSEAAGLAVVGGVQLRPVATERGILSAGQIKSAVRPLDDDHQPFTAAVSVENTHNGHGGIAWPLADLQSVKNIADDNRISLHMDGARLFNASIASQISVRDISACADTLTFCLSKGLGCPAGSILVGSVEQIRLARRWRKLLGGGMRQAGVLAAAGLYALDNMVDRLNVDHHNAYLIARGIVDIDGISVDLTRVQTNIVYLDLDAVSAADFLLACRDEGLLGLAMAERTVRFVTHYGIEEKDANKVPQLVARALQHCA
jgi:threonine aldolase